MSETKVTLPGAVRFSYPALIKPHTTPNGEEKYQLTLLIPKSDTATTEVVKSGANAAVEKGKTEKWGGQVPKNLKLPLLDGDGLTPSGEAWPDECKGCWIVRTSANADYPPRVFDNTQGNKELKGEEIRKVYAGCWGSATLNFFPYKSAGNVGVGVGLLGVLFIKDGEALSGASASVNDFAAFVPQAPVASDDPLAAMLGG